MDYFPVGEWDVEFYNPSKLSLGAIEFPELPVFSPMDRVKLNECDIAFGYMEKSNPTPINIALEMGYAKGLGKITILCNEWTPEAYEQRDMKTLATSADSEAYATWYKPHYVDLLNSWMDFVEPDFGVAIEILKKVLLYEIN